MKNNNVVHVMSGPSAADSLRQALHITRVIAPYDALDWGPICDFNSIEEWNASREQYFRDSGWGDDGLDANLHIHKYESEDPFALLREADEIIIWIGTAVREQLFLCWIIRLFEVSGISTDKIKLVETYSYEKETKQFRILGTGELHPEQLKSFYDAGNFRVLNKDDIVEIKYVWEAVTHPTPERLNVVDFSKKLRFPLMLDGLRYFMRRYPDAKTGLNFYTTFLLKECKERQSKAARIIGMTMGHLIDYPDVCGDLPLFVLLLMMGSKNLPFPAVEIFGKGENMRFTEVAITEKGTQFLNGEDNFVVRNGVDYWVGGVHLNSENHWFYKDDKIVKN